MDIEACLDCYCDPFYHEFYGINKEITDNKVLCEQSRDFLLKYALNESEYSNQCVPILRKVFGYLPEQQFDVSSMPLSDMKSEDCFSFSYFSSPLLWNDTYELIQEICKESGDRNIFIVEEACCEKIRGIAFKLRIPVCVSWEELSNGGYISDVLFNMHNHNYYFFGDSGNWGRWCDYDNAYADYEIFIYKYLTPQISAYKTYFSEYITESIVPEKCLGIWDRIRKHFVF